MGITLTSSNAGYRGNGKAVTTNIERKTLKESGWNTEGRTRLSNKGWKVDRSKLINPTKGWYYKRLDDEKKRKERMSE